MAVGDNHQGGIFQAWIAEQLARQTGHLDALASALGVPNHATFFIAIRSACCHHPLNCFSDGVELVVGSDFFDDLPVFLKQAKTTNELQQTPLIENAPHQGLQVTVSTQRINFVVNAFDRAPALKPFPISTQGAQPCLDAIADHQQHIGREQIWNVLLIGLKLVECRPDASLLIGGVFQFDHRQRQTVQVDHQIGAAIVLSALDRQLVHHQPVVGSGVVEADHLEADPHLLVPIHIGDGQSLGHPAVEVAVGGQQPRHIGVRQLEHR